MSKLNRIKLLLLVATCFQWTLGSDYGYNHNQPSYKSSIIKALSLGAIVMMEGVNCDYMSYTSVCNVMEYAMSRDYPLLQSSDSSCDSETCSDDTFPGGFPSAQEFTCPATPAAPGFHWIKDSDNNNKCFYSDGTTKTHTVGNRIYSFKSTGVAQNQCSSALKGGLNNFVPKFDNFVRPTAAAIYWDSDTEKCYFFDGNTVNKDATSTKNNIETLYTHVSTKCKATSCTSAHMDVFPEKDEFLCLKKSILGFVWDADKKLCLYSDATTFSDKFTKDNNNGPVGYTYGSYETTCVSNDGALCDTTKAINKINNSQFVCQESSKSDVAFEPNCGTGGICYVKNAVQPSISDCNDDSQLYSFQSTKASCLSSESCTNSFVASGSGIASVSADDFECKKHKPVGFYWLTGSKCETDGACYYSDGTSASGLEGCDNQPWNLYKFQSDSTYGCNKANCVSSNTYLTGNKPGDNKFLCMQKTYHAPYNNNVYFDPKSKICFFHKSSVYQCQYPTSNGYKSGSTDQIIPDNTHPDQNCFSFFSQHGSCNSQTCKMENLNGRANQIVKSGFTCSDNALASIPLVLPTSTSTFFEPSSGLCYFYEKTVTDPKTCSYPNSAGSAGTSRPSALVNDNIHNKNQCFTWVSSVCNPTDCVAEKLLGLGKSINSDNFVCNNNQLELDIENVVFANGICFGGYGAKSTDKPCYYPTKSGSYNFKSVGSIVNDLQITSSDGGLSSSNKCYKFKSFHKTCNADTCQKSILKTISQDNFDCWSPQFEECEYQGTCSSILGGDEYSCIKTDKECKVKQDGKEYVINKIYTSYDCDQIKKWTGSEREKKSAFCEFSSANIITVTITVLGSVMGSLLMFW